MVITKKEKVLIFILILILLVGGTYTLGIMPKLNKTKDIQAEKTGVEQEIAETRAAARKTSPAEREKYKTEIRRNSELLASYAEPKGKERMTEESLPVSTKGYRDENDAMRTMTVLLGEWRVSVDPATASVQRTDLSGSVVYALTTPSYECACLADLFLFLDRAAEVPSYNVTALSCEVADDGTVTGMLTFIVTLLG